MPRFNEIPEVRIEVIRQHSGGKKFREIARNLNLSYDGVRKIIVKFKKYGAIRNLPRSGRPRATTEREDRAIKNCALKDPNTSASDILEITEIDISPHTGQRRLNEHGLKGRVARRVPFISEKNRVARLEFARRHIDRPMDFWRSILWSDESKFEQANSERRQVVWRKDGEAFNPKYTVGTVKHAKHIMLWGCFCADGVGDLVEIDGKMTGTMYRDILRDHLVQSVEKLRLGSGFIFQQDNDPKHTSKVPREYFADTGIVVLGWPAQSPDLNPIEHLWDELDRKLPKYARKNISVFRKSLFEEWSKIEVPILEKLVNSMRSRLMAVIEARGGPTGYSFSKKLN